MNARFPLYSKILLWLLLNLVALACAAFLLLRVQFRFGLDWLIAGRGGDRIQAVAEVIMGDLAERPREEWDPVLDRFSRAYGVRFLLFRNEGPQLAGEPTGLPAEVAEKLRGRTAPPPGRPPDPARELGPEFRREPPPERMNLGSAGPGPVRGRFMVRAGEPLQYWVGVRVPPPDRRQTRGPVTLLAASESLRGGGLFFDTTPWWLGALGVLLFTALFWFPFVRGITAAIGRMTRATERIAAGQFDTRLRGSRADELGRLSDAINRMAARLAGYVTGQKRFLGDIAHELCSPLARIQLALGILEQRADEKQKAYVEDVREEVQQMSQLVGELLSFSKASLKPQDIQLRPVNLAEIARRVVAREAADTSQVVLEVSADLVALAEPELLSRALANLLRNAIRYAGHAGPITLSARRDGGRVLLQVADAGPGVPETTLGQLFQPFHRPDAARGRETGGAGLGLAIVKSCVDACQGTVACRNLTPAGFAVDIGLKGHSPEAT